MWSRYPEIQRELKLVEDYIKKSIPSRNKLLSTVVSELIDAGGKRLRPAFVILAAKFGKYNRKKVLSMAGALEVLHTATLVHDDVIDQAKSRRGKLTISEKYGIDMAIYTGDFLFTKAVLMLSKDISSDKLDIIAKAIKIICEGEVDQYQDRYKLDTTIYSYLKRISKKTAVLFSASCSIGGYLAKCSAATTKNLAKFGFYYGMAFQIRDDLNDLLSDSKTSGKPVASDILKGIITLPVICAAKRSGEVRELLSGISLNKEEPNFERISKISSLVKEYGGIEDAKLLLKRYIAKGKNILEKVPENRFKEVFNELINDLEI